ncbi:hypothetical protein ACFY0G_30205 [Streptomyces sp. NPDC001552]|uniref:hypothetical protein n=1 Tax=Streptomyces sp. NPDC001552 TaxID=3364587 RepID=UPI0036B22FA3|nr:hypothetical protein OG365_38235 [Streptomyces sp. NBC_00853]
MEDTTGFCKVLAESGPGRHLGAYPMGPQAPALIQPLVLAATHPGTDATTLTRPPYPVQPERFREGTGRVRP